ncbi:MAG: hypothetical protein NUV47_01105 [Patescibacteria group bacterium]|nr:hypothetical protein [Patescibacteria group bacterium]
MEQNNSNIPVVKVGDTIYELCGYGYCSNLSKRKVERITNTQIILDRGTKPRNNPLKMYGDKGAYYLNAVGRNIWSNVNYYLETEELITQYKHEQLLLKTKKILESLDLKKLTDEQLSTLLSAMTQIQKDQNDKEKTQHE